MLSNAELMRIEGFGGMFQKAVELYHNFRKGGVDSSIVAQIGSEIRNGVKLSRADGGSKFSSEELDLLDKFASELIEMAKLS